MVGNMSRRDWRREKGIDGDPGASCLVLAFDGWDQFRILPALFPCFEDGLIGREALQEIQSAPEIVSVDEVEEVVFYLETLV